MWAGRSLNKAQHPSRASRWSPRARPAAAQLPCLTASGPAAPLVQHRPPPAPQGSPTAPPRRRCPVCMQDHAPFELHGYNLPPQAPCPHSSSQGVEPECHLHEAEKANVVRQMCAGMSLEASHPRRAKGRASGAGSRTPVAPQCAPAAGPAKGGRRINHFIRLTDSCGALS